MAIDVGEIVATLKGDTKGFEQAMGKSTQSMIAVGAGSVALGNIAAQAFNHVLAGAMSATSAIVRWAGEASAAAERTRILSMQLGIADYTLEAWGMAATHAGGSIETLSSGMRTLSRHLEGLGAGAEESVELFNKLGSGMSTVELAGLDTEQAIRLIADRFAGMNDGAEKSKLALDLLGRSGLQLLPILNQGSAGLDQAAAKAKEFGVALTDTQRAALDKYDQAVDNMSSALEGFKNSVAAAFAPSLTKNVEWMTSAVSYAKSIFTQFADAAEKLFIRFGAMSAAIQLMGQQLFSMSVFSKEAWLQTLDQVKAIDSWAAAQIKAIDVGKNAEVQMEATKKKTVEYTVSQKNLGEAIVAATKIQLSQQEALGKQQERMGQAIVDNQKTQDSITKSFFAEQLAGDDRRMKDAYAGSAVMIENVLTKQKAMKDMQADIQKGIDAETQAYIDGKMEEEAALTKQTAMEIAAAGKAEEALGKFVVMQEQKRQSMQFGWADVFGSMSQSAQFAFGQIRASFGNSVVSLMRGTATWATFWKSTQDTILNSAVQWGIDIVGRFVAKNAMILATEMATATTMAGIWTSTAAFVTGTFGALTGAIMGFFTATIIPFFVSIGTMLMTFLSAIAAAASATIFGIPYGVAILVGVGLIAAAIGSLYAFGAFAEGGVVTKPMMGLVGEAGPEAIIPLSKLGQMNGGGPTTVIIELDGRTIAKSVYDNMPSVMRVRGVSA